MWKSRTAVLIVSTGMTVVVLAAIVGTGVFGVSALYQRMDGVESACAAVFDSHKTELAGTHWDWIPPSWVCDFYGDPSSRRLPLFRR